MQEFQRQQREFLKFENRNEEGRAEQALRLVSFSEALTEASLPRSKAMDDAASLGGTSSLNTIQTSSAILVESEAAGSEEYVTLEKAASGTEALRAGHPAVKQLGEKTDKNRKPSGPPRAALHRHPCPLRPSLSKGRPARRTGEAGKSPSRGPQRGRSSHE